MTIFNKITFLDKLLFTKHLSIMVRSGITLSEAVSTLAEQTANLNFKKVLVAIGADLLNGQGFKVAIAKYPAIFDPLYLNLVGIGEETGTLEGNLEYLAAQLQKSYEFKKKVQGAMMYPTLIMVVAVVMGSGIAIFVLPQLASLFTSLDVELPLTTKILLFVADFFKNYGIIAVPAFLALLLGLVRLAKAPMVAPVWHRLLLRLPIFGQFLISSESAAFCRNLGLMLKSGLPIAQAIKAVETGTENLVFRGYAGSLYKAVEGGLPLGKELSGGRYKYFPLIVAKMVAVGEKTGKLDEVLLYLGDFFAEEVDETAKNLPSILEPVLLVVIAGMVLFLALAIISPIYELTANVRK